MRLYDAAPEDHYYLLEELYTVAGLSDRRGWPLTRRVPLRGTAAKRRPAKPVRRVKGWLEEAYVYDTYGHVTIEAWPEGDVNVSGLVNMTDYSMVRSLIGSGDPWGDANWSGTVNNIDASLVKNWSGNTTAELTYSGLDNAYFFTGRTTDTLHADDTDPS